MKEVLIVRSASFQQLDNSLPRVQDQFPGARISLLTHEQGMRLANKYDSIQEVIPYRYKAGFSFLRPATDIQNKNYDVVIVPVSNLSGSGFYNVLFFSVTIKAKERWMCNLISEFLMVSVSGLIFLGIKNALFRLLSIIGSVLLVIPYILFLSVTSLTIGRKEGKE